MNYKEELTKIEDEILESRFIKGEKVFWNGKECSVEKVQKVLNEFIYTVSFAEKGRYILQEGINQSELK
jgi:hypothetical protein